MSKIYKSVNELIGNTPILELTNIEKDLELNAKILVKLESFNPAGSAKDRVALNMITEAEKRGDLKPGSVIIEPTSGNTGIGLCAVGASKGYKVIIVMPDTMSVERRLLMKAYGAQLILTDGKLGMPGAIKKAEELVASTPGAFLAGQFTNPDNPLAHFKSTGPEIWTDTDGEIDYFIAGVGTGGTITGTGQYLKSKNPGIKVIAVEPKTSAVLSGENAGPHDLQGIGGGFIPDVLDTSIYDEITTVSDEEAYETGRILANKEGILAGITSGAALFAAIKLAKRPEAKGKTIVALLPDTGERYLSSKMWNS